MKKILFSALLLGIFSLLGCREKMPAAEAAQLSVTQKEVNLRESESSVNISIKTNRTCTVESSSEWCKGFVKGTVLTITARENPDKGVRSAEITIRCEEKSETVTVRQLGWGKQILVAPTAIAAQAVGGDFNITVTANIGYDIVTDADWIIQEPATKAHEMVNYDYVLRIASNKKPAGRSTEVVFRDKAGDQSLDTKLPVSQSGLDEYDSTGEDALKDDIQIRVEGGEASSYQNGEDLSRSYDGDMNTLYHSNYNNTAPDYFPITLTYNFSEGTNIDYLVYHPRTTANPNGNFKETDIYYKLRGGDWVLSSSENFNGSGTSSRVDFQHQLQNVESIRFVVKSGAGDGQGFAACAEMKFYQVNADKFNPLSLFADQACSALKPGITDSEIADCKSIFFKNIAIFMKEGKYPSEFRIQEYKAYPNPMVKASENKTQPYSFLDNASGIFARTGESLVIMVDGLGKRSAALYVQNLDKPGGDGFWGQQYNLSDGINKIKVNEKGLLYIIYQPEDYQTAPSIKVHIASGEVNGYFDVKKHRASDWGRLLSASKSGYFDVLGEYAHLTFPTSRFRELTPDGEKLIRAYDNIVRYEQEFMGLMKYGRTFPNRMHLIVIYKAYMYATSFYTAYNDNTLTDLCNLSMLTTGACWGPAHEIGHCNQTRPGFKWHGTTEVTNNVMSEYIQTVLFRQPSRLQTENMGDGLPNRYAKAWKDIVASGSSYSDFPGESDVFCKLVPLWQLQLYFGKVLGQSSEQTPDKGGFYADVYEYIRTHPDLLTPGEQQTEFAYICSKTAQMNLVDFFEKWGFFRPVDKVVDDYGKATVKVTEEMSAAVRQRIGSLGFPEPDIALEYISDNNYELYKSKPVVIPGSASRNGNTVTMKDWKNVVVYEVRDASDKLVFASEGVLEASNTASFNVPEGWKAGYKVYALSATRAKTPVTL